MYSIDRLKKLLEKKRRALLLPKSELADYEEEYIELLSRIENERRKLHIDDDTIYKWFSKLEEKYKNSNTAWSMDNGYISCERINSYMNTIIKCAENGDIDDLKYYRNQLIAEWKSIHESAQKNIQITL